MRAYHREWAGGLSVVRPGERLFAQFEGLGAIYPFLGWEGLMILMVAAFWIGWTIWQLRTESEEYARTAQAVRETGELTAALAEAEPPQPQPVHSDRA
jgi:hypothetical protein